MSRRADHLTPDMFDAMKLGKIPEDAFKPTKTVPEKPIVKPETKPEVKPTIEEDTYDAFEDLGYRRRK